MNEDHDLLGPVEGDKSASDKSNSKKHALVVKFKELDKKAESWIQSWNPYHPALVQQRNLKPVVIEESQMMKQIGRFFLIAFGIFLIWAFIAPIDSGVATNGSVVVSGYRKLLQHPSGGIVQEILVKEGDMVNEGDILIRINPLSAQADLSTAQLQYINALVTEARLQAERKGENKITWPAALETWEKDPKVIEAKDIQQKLFDTRRSEFSMVVSSKRTQLASLTQEANANAALAKEGYVSQAQANQVIRLKIDAEAALKSLESAYYKDIDGQLAQIQATRDAMRDRFKLVELNRDLTSIRAPVSGRVVGLKPNTVGGTVSGGTTLAEIVPSEVALIAEVQVPPNIIDRVKVGMPVDMRFTGLSGDYTPLIAGKVSYVGIDLQPPNPSAPAGSGDYYLAKIEATKEGLELLSKVAIDPGNSKAGNIEIHPGMPVDVVFKTGERTFMSYLIRPLTDKFAMAFK